MIPAANAPDGIVTVTSLTVTIDNAPAVANEIPVVTTGRPVSSTRLAELLGVIKNGVPDSNLLQLHIICLHRIYEYVPVKFSIVRRFVMIQGIVYSVVLRNRVKSVTISTGDGRRTIDVEDVFGRPNIHVGDTMAWDAAGIVWIPKHSGKPIGLQHVNKSLVTKKSL